MKRSADLQSLSREHHTALVLAKACERAADSRDAEQVGATCERAIRAFAHDLDPHFLIEEQVLLPLLNDAEKPLVERTLADHRQLRGLLKYLQRNDVDALANFAKCLAAHVRFEERELFPALENFSSGD